jgi:hypothetical protein
VKGAALSGLIGIKPSSRVGRRHYGFDWGLPFRNGIDSEEDGYIDPYDGKKKCTGRMEWQVSKGAQIDEKSVLSREIRRPWSPGQSRIFTDELYSCDLDEAPEYVSSPGVELVGSISIDFTKVPISWFEKSSKRGKPTYQFEYRLRARLATKEGVLTFQALVGDDVVGTTEIEFTKGN